MSVGEGRLENRRSRGAFVRRIVDPVDRVEAADLDRRTALTVARALTHLHAGGGGEDAEQGGPKIGADERVPEHRRGLFEDLVVSAERRLFRGRRARLAGALQSVHCGLLLVVELTD